ncbi:MAG: hypothetical protein ACOYJQ_15785 [Pseudochelatococcus sp.]|uniref:hypothetical protein n=1 Tax=Pseudochelatococcus sp. TaxID=2020869 RepID=UPI003D8CAB67
MKVLAVLALVLLAGAAQAQDVDASAGAAEEDTLAIGSSASAATGPKMFSPEWRAQKMREREANLEALQEEQRRFDQWERSAKRAVGGVCANCLKSGSGAAGSITIPSDLIPNYGAVESGAGFDETSAFYTVPAATSPAAAPAVAAPAAAPAPARARSSAPAPSGRWAAPLDIRPPAAR